MIGNRRDEQCGVQHSHGACFGVQSIVTSLRLPPLLPLSCLYLDAIFYLSEPHSEVSLGDRTSGETKPGYQQLGFESRQEPIKTPPPSFPPLPLFLYPRQARHRHVRIGSITLISSSDHHGESEESLSYGFWEQLRCFQCCLSTAQCERCIELPGSSQGTYPLSIDPFLQDLLPAA